MKKLIPILIVALLLAVGLTLPAIEPADAMDHHTVNKSVSTDTATVGDWVTYYIVANNYDLVAVEVLEVCDDLIGICLSTGWTIESGGSQAWGFDYQVTEGDVGFLTNCANVTFVDNAGNQFTRTDCVHLTVEPLVIDVDVDIKPGSFPNSINPNSKGVIPVAILTTAAFDASTVDPTTVAFGPADAAPAHRHAHIEDVDGDGDLDLVLHFKTQETGIAAGDMQAILTGETWDGVPIAGTDSVMTVPPST